jgi:hypothetical protein
LDAENAYRPRRKWPTFIDALRFPEDHSEEQDSINTSDSSDSELLSVHGDHAVYPKSVGRDRKPLNEFINIDNFGIYPEIKHPNSKRSSICSEMEDDDDEDDELLSDVDFGPDALINYSSSDSECEGSTGQTKDVVNSINKSDDEPAQAEVEAENEGQLEQPISGEYQQPSQSEGKADTRHEENREGISEEQLLVVNNYLAAVPGSFKLMVPMAAWEKFCVPSSVELVRKKGTVHLRTFDWIHPDGQNYIYRKFTETNKYCCLVFTKKRINSDISMVGSSQSQVRLYATCKNPSCRVSYVFTVQKIPRAGDVAVCVR